MSKDVSEIFGLPGRVFVLGSNSCDLFACSVEASVPGLIYIYSSTNHLMAQVTLDQTHPTDIMPLLRLQPRLVIQHRIITHSQIASRRLLTAVIRCPLTTRRTIKLMGHRTLDLVLLVLRLHHRLRWLLVRVLRLLLGLILMNIRGVRIMMGGLPIT